MAGEELQIVRLKDDFYRDGFYKVVIALATIIGAIIFLIAISIYLYQSKPPPVYFSSDNEWRILAPVPLDKPYLSTADLSQWVSESIPAAVNYDFINYSLQLKNNIHYFTADGWKKFLVFLNIYASEKSIVDGKLFVSSSPSGAPTITNQGLLENRYAWWVNMPLAINYSNGNSTEASIDVLVVRVSTLNNLYGVAIDNIVVSKGGGGASSTNG